jgi:hypothetical protein
MGIDTAPQAAISETKTLNKPYDAAAPADELPIVATDRFLAATNRDARYIAGAGGIAACRAGSSLSGC